MMDVETMPLRQRIRRVEQLLIDEHENVAPPSDRVTQPIQITLQQFRPRQHTMSDKPTNMAQGQGGSTPRDAPLTAATTDTSKPSIAL